jgi:hypothetical protein
MHQEVHQRTRENRREHSLLVNSNIASRSSPSAPPLPRARSYFLGFSILAYFFTSKIPPPIPRTFFAKEYRSRGNEEVNLAATSILPILLCTRRPCQRHIHFATPFCIVFYPGSETRPSKREITLLRSSSTLMPLTSTIPTMCTTRTGGTCTPDMVYRILTSPRLPPFGPFQLILIDCPSPDTRICLEKQGKYEEALADRATCISMEPQFVKGRLHSHLQR